jgi:hypothetical protein
LNPQQTALINHWPVFRVASYKPVLHFISFSKYALVFYNLILHPKHPVFFLQSLQLFPHIRTQMRTESIFLEVLLLMARWCKCHWSNSILLNP